MSTETFPLAALKDIWDSAAVPCVTWEPSYYEESAKITILHTKILGGEYDPYLSSVAQMIKQWGHPVLIRFAHEMNLLDYHWGTSLEDFGPASPQVYIQIVRYVVDLFRQQEVSNVLWVFCPNADS